MKLQPTLSNDLVTIKPVQQNDFESLFAIASDNYYGNNTRITIDIKKKFLKCFSIMQFSQKVLL